MEIEGRTNHPIFIEDNPLNLIQATGRQSAMTYKYECRTGNTTWNPVCFEVACK